MLSPKIFRKFLIISALLVSLSGCFPSQKTGSSTPPNLSPIPTSTHPGTIQSPAPTVLALPAHPIFYHIDNIHEVVVRPGGNELYATSMHTSSVLIVDINSPGYPVLGEIVLPGGEIVGYPAVTFSKDGAFAYMARRHNPDFIASWGLKDDNYIVVVDCVNRKIDHIIPMKPYMLDSWVVPSRDAKTLYFVGFIPGDKHGIGQLDLSSQKVVNFSSFGDYITSPYIKLSEDGKNIYAVQGDIPNGTQKNQFIVIDAQTFKITSSIEVGKGPWFIAVTPDGHKAYVSNQWSNDVSVINLETMEIITTILVGPEPKGIAITPDGSKAYVALPEGIAVSVGGRTPLGGNSVAVLDIKNDQYLGAVKVHFNPEAVSMDPDGTRVYVSDGSANGPQRGGAPAEVQVIRTTDDKLLNPIILREGSQYGPAGIDVTPDNQKLFITNMPRESLIAIDIASGKIIS